MDQEALIPLSSMEGVHAHQRQFVGPFLHEMEGKYQFLERVGSGRYSIVYKTCDLATDAIVAVKKIPYKKVIHGVPCSVIREVSLLKELDHENIVRLLDVYPTDEEICLVFEYLDCTLHKFIKTESAKVRDPQVIKKFMYQILSGVAYCHSQKILHRDLKPENILVDIHNLVVKLSDFGISREVTVPRKAYTSKVATLQYMAPEILFGYPQYSYPMDIWAVGCIFGEMVKGRKIFRGYQLIDQIHTIFSVLGTPDEETWPGITKIFPYLHKMEKCSPQNMENEVQGLEPDGVNLLSEMLRLDPSKRITAHDALKHPYFSDL